MPAQVTSAFRRFGRALREFTVAQRTVALIGVAVLVLGIAALTMWAGKPAFTPLFSGLSGSDANTIVDQLRTDGVPYELSDGGATILVPEKSVYDERLKAAAAGLPTSSTGGYALLDKMGVTASEFQQSVTYKRALEGELAATIEALDGVRTASVRLAIPKESVFVEEANDPTASVFIETESGVTLAGEQVEAIVHLTSASIDGMAPSDVAVVDAGGSVLSAVGVGATGSADKQSSVYEQRVRDSVQSMLDKIVGPGNASVIVAADMSYESAERVEETFTAPEDSPALNESTKTETYAGGKGGGTGVLGPDNIAVPAGSAGDGTFKSEDTTRNNAINKVTESRTIPAGSLNRQTVSVAVSSAAAGDLDVANLSSLVAAAAGIDTERGDDVTVELVSFNTAGAKEAAEALAAAAADANAERLMELLRIGIIVAGILIPFILGMIVYARRSSRQSRESIDVGELRTGLDEPTIPLLQAAPFPTRVIAPGPPISYEPTTAENLREEIDALAHRDPKGTAQYLRGFMDERQPA